MFAYFAYAFHAYISCIFSAYFQVLVYKCTGDILLGPLLMFAYSVHDYLCIF